jgi:lysophospholipase L1-like esterase
MRALLLPAALLALVFPATVFPQAAPAAAPAATPPTRGPERWEKDIRAFEAQDARQPPPADGILFTGSSSIRLWKTLAEDFPGQPVINRGFGGSEMSDSVHFAARTILKHRPRQVLVYAGANDIKNGKTPAEVLTDFQALVGKIRAARPDTRIGFIATAPNPARWALIDQYRDVNARVAAYCREQGLDYIDVHTAMLGEDGLPLPDIFVADRLHMNEKGYAIWKRVIGPFLQP